MVAARVREIAAWLLIVAIGLVAELYLVPPAHATNYTQKTTLYLKKEPSDINATYNALTLSNADTQADTATATQSSTLNFSSTAPAFCKSSDETGETYTQVSAAATSTGERCIATFISDPVGSSFSVATSDTASISANIYSSESSSHVTSSPNIYIYRWTGSGTSLATTDLIASWTTCADPGTTPSVCTAAQTAVSPANNITFAATDRIIVIVTQTITHTSKGAYVSNYFDNSTRAPSADITLGYPIIAPNAPALTGAQDDDFNVAEADTTCASTGYDSKWSCPAPAATGSLADINSADASGTGGDSSSWLVLRNQCATCTVSNFGGSGGTGTPSNAFIYQDLPTGYGDGSIETVVNSALSYQIGASTPTATSSYNHAGLVLWLANNDFLELQLYSTGAKTTANTVYVAVNNSGTLGTGISLNPTTTSGSYGLVWLRFAKTSTSYQAQYSTNGSTWTNVGSAITHTSAFARVGLNAFAAINGANYAAAFDYFSYGFAAPPGPTVSQRMRDGKWWSGGAEQNYWLN